MTKEKLIALIVGGVACVTLITCSFFLEKDKMRGCEHETPVENTVTENNIHDWECKFCIEDGYSGEGKVMYHYINEYTRNVDHSITFVGHDGLLWTIPYPYFYIHVNEHFKGSEQNVNPNAK